MLEMYRKETSFFLVWLDWTLLWTTSDRFAQIFSRKKFNTITLTVKKYWGKIQCTLEILFGLDVYFLRLFYSSPTIDFFVNPTITFAQKYFFFNIYRLYSTFVQWRDENEKLLFLTAEAVLVIAFTPPTPPPLQFRTKLF